MSTATLPRPTMTTLRSESEAQMTSDRARPRAFETCHTQPLKDLPRPPHTWTRAGWHAWLLCNLGASRRCVFRHGLIINIVSSVCSFAVEPLRSHQPHHTVVSAERQTSACDRGGISCCMIFVLRTPITTLLRSSLDSIVAGVGGGVKKSACIVVTRRISR